MNKLHFVICSYGDGYLMAKVDDNNGYTISHEDDDNLFSVNHFSMSPLYVDGKKWDKVSQCQTVYDALDEANKHYNGIVEESQA